MRGERRVPKKPSADRSLTNDQNFSLLYSGDLNQLKHRDPSAWGEMERLDFLTRQLRDKTGTSERIFEAGILRNLFGARGTDTTLITSFEAAFKRAQEFMRWLIENWLPESYWPRFSSDGIVSSTNNLKGLLLLRERYLQETDLLSRQREFEIRRIILLGTILFELSLLAKDQRMSGELLRSVTEYLEEEFFSDEVANDDLIYFQDPDDEMRIRHCYWRLNYPEYPDSWIKRSQTMLCRKFSWEGEDYYVYYEPREKDPFAQLLKMLRKGIRDPNIILDQIGFKLVFFSQDGLRAALQKLRCVVFPFPGTTWKIHDSLTCLTANGVPRNNFSSPKWKVIKFITRFNGFWIEGMLERINDHLNATMSLGDENRVLYKLKGMIDRVFPLLFPFNIYGIDWRSNEVRNVLFEMHRAKIK